MDNLFYEKYLKYKAKYLALGGMEENGKKIKGGGPNNGSNNGTESSSNEKDTKVNKASLSCSCKVI